MQGNLCVYIVCVCVWMQTTATVLTTTTTTRFLHSLFQDYPGSEFRGMINKPPRYLFSFCTSNSFLTILSFSGMYIVKRSKHVFMVLQRNMWYPTLVFPKQQGSVHMFFTIYCFSFTIKNSKLHFCVWKYFTADKINTDVKFLFLFSTIINLEKWIQIFWCAFNYFINIFIFFFVLIVVTYLKKHICLLKKSILSTINETDYHLTTQIVQGHITHLNLEQTLW